MTESYHVCSGVSRSTCLCQDPLSNIPVNLLTLFLAQAGYQYAPQSPQCCQWSPYLQVHASRQCAACGASDDDTQADSLQNHLQHVSLLCSCMCCRRTFNGFSLRSWSYSTSAPVIKLAASPLPLDQGPAGCALQIVLSLTLNASPWRMPKRAPVLPAEQPPCPCQTARHPLCHCLQY